MKEFIKVVVAFYMAINLPLFLFACLRQMFDRTGPRKMLRIELLFPGAILGRAGRPSPQDNGLAHGSAGWIPQVWHMPTQEERPRGGWYVLRDQMRLLQVCQ